jgi:hypothetical protein
MCCVFECDQVKINNLDTCCEQVGRRGKDNERKPRLLWSLISPYHNILEEKGPQALRSYLCTTTWSPAPPLTLSSRPDVGLSSGPFVIFLSH